MNTKKQTAGVGPDGLSKSTRDAVDSLRIVAADADPPSPEHQLTTDAAIWDAYVAGCEAGGVAGFTAGYQAAENDMARSWAALAQRIRRMANSPAHAELVRRRAG